ncbi:asparagine synthase (glutamine-hydrolyzing) [Salinimicrobium xinjiangense]|uniref:asparagine synthase (glutamine-hydrolyzing) n=1 Tax=Salinimicrobium xinjiangense TaxID=438596 RepID=UPI000422A4F7|nr:asparagine synthase (glutamine-hydrolyzing) [Salinimicrobium xinjiangense]
MCGICGVINIDKNKIVKESDIKGMMAVMKHRGPDDEGTFINNNVGLGFVRLSIIDLSPAGHQPFKSTDGRFIMVFNGEIFNYIELKDELKKEGYFFKTETDTEVLFNAYLHWGESVLHRLNGMWAFAIYDTFEETIFFARDRFGIKPFYYSLTENNLIFASEIPPILEILKKKPTPNYDVVFDFLVYNKTEHSEKTFFSEVNKLMHGHSIKLDLKKKKRNLSIYINKWYNINSRVKNARPFCSPDDYKQAFESAIDLRLRSDVPVGVSFSGGLDSSAITSVVIDTFKKNDLNTFSAVYDKSFSGDESKFMKLYDDKPGRRHYTTPSAESLLDDLDEFISCHAEPVPTTSPYAQYKIMELASKNVVVTLDGQGADEQLAGYHYFFGFYFKDLLKQGKFTSLNREIYSYLKIHKSTFGLKTFLFFLLPKTTRTKLKVSELGYITSEFAKRHNKTNIISDYLYASNSLQEALVNHFEYKLEHLLKWEDRNSMHFSLEARVPFLDYRLVERTLATNSKEIIKNGMTKNLLRESMKGVVPEEIRMRVDKEGYSTPQDEWFRSKEWEEKIWDILKSDSFKSRNIFNVNRTQQMFKEHLNREKNLAKELWKWIHLELWFRKYID